MYIHLTKGTGLISDLFIWDILEELFVKNIVFIYYKFRINYEIILIRRRC